MPTKRRFTRDRMALGAKMTLSGPFVTNPYRTSMLERGAQLTEIQRILGHSRLETTGRYVTPSEEDLRIAILKAGV